jgi:hypothetical protein
MSWPLNLPQTIVAACIVIIVITLAKCIWDLRR